MLTDVPTDVYLLILLRAAKQGSVHCGTTLTGQQVLARQATSARFASGQSHVPLWLPNPALYSISDIGTAIR